ncbi:flavin-binding monooxygenase-like protein [Diplocarpon rosae]|nr:flavin-binding monooxygenase-like protein [Diplocarpon rosae]
MKGSIETADLVVVGAGWFGLAAAKTHLQVHPSSKMIVLEAESSVGGVWGNGRLYPTLKSNNMVGTYENPDFPMDEATWGVKPGQHIPAIVMHEYLTAFAKKFGVWERTRFNCRVESIEHGEKEGWKLTVGGGGEGMIVTKKLVLATGMTSHAFLPTFKGHDKFERPLFHIAEFFKHQETLETLKNVTVLGGTKSAWDAVYAYATHGVHVDWIIRESGHGTCWISPPYVTPFKKWLEKLIHTRLLTWMSPCIWGAADGYGTIRSCLHGTAIGRFFVDRFWAVLGADIVDLMKYDAHPETAKLKPWMEPFWTGNGLGILNYPTPFFDLLESGQAKVHITDIDRLEKGRVFLSSGESIETDAMLCATGWKHSSPMEFIPSSLEAELGLPTLRGSNIPRIQAESNFLTAKADDEILSMYPRLKTQPKGNPKLKPLPSSEDDAVRNEELTAMDLYRFMVPANPKFFAHRDIAFVGHLLTISTAIIAQIQGLWVTAYFDGKIMPSGDGTDLRYQARLHNRFGKWRYPHGWGGQIPDFVFDSVPYIDLLLKDLGLQNRRKGGWFEEITRPYGPEDYRGIVREWIAKEEK